MASDNCVFCPDNWGNLDVVAGPITLPDGEAGKVLIINPLDPVTEGHVLLIHETHGENLASNYKAARDLGGVAAWYMRHQDQPEGSFQANVITSMGPHATQTVMHTHVHIVPRRENDGLPLPWTPQHEAKRRAELAERARESSDRHERKKHEDLQPARDFNDRLRGFPTR